MNFLGQARFGKPIWTGLSKTLFDTFNMMVKHVINKTKASLQRC